MRKFLSVLVSLLLGFSSFLPTTANAVTPATAPGTYSSIDQTSPLNIDGYDVAAVKQATFLVVWTRYPVSQDIQSLITQSLQNVPGSQSTTNAVYFSGVPAPGQTITCPAPAWADSNFGQYYVQYGTDGHLYLHATKISHYVVGNNVFPSFKVKKEITGTSTFPDSGFDFVLKEGSTTVGTAHADKADTPFSFNLNSNFHMPITFTMNEVQPSPVPTGWTYSAISYTVTIDQNLNLTYVENDSSLLQCPPSTTTPTIFTFTNNYTTPPPATVDIHGTKAVTGTPTTTPTFSFVLKDGTTTVGTAQVTGAGDFTFTNIPVPASGSKTLTMSEQTPTPVPTGWTYSTASYTVTIQSNGSVVYNTSDGRQPTFTNSYITPPPATVDIHGTKAVTGNPTTIPNGGFSFVLKDGTTTVGTAQVSGAGNFTFANIPVPASGSKTLTMSEVQPGTIPTGWTYSGATYNVIVGADGSVSYQTSAGIPLDGLPTFTNSYTTPVLSTIHATKIIAGSPTAIPDGGFSFVLKDGTTTVGTAQTDKAGTVTFSMSSNFQLPANGTTTLVMSEVQPGTIPTGWTYSGATYNVIVGADGSVSYQTNDGIPLDGLPVFINSYLATPTLSDIQATKIITGSPTTIPDGGFSFVLKDGANTVGTAQTDKAGTVTFSMGSNFQLPASGTTTLVMSEVQPGTIPTGWTYSGATYNVIVGADGSVSYQTSDGIPLDGLPTFTNSYTAPVLSAIQATKIIAGNPTTIPDGGFSFVLKDGSTTVGTAQTDKSGTVTFSMDSNFQLPASGTTTLVMSEVQPGTVPTGWTYSNATYNVIVGADGSVSYQTSDSIALPVLPIFINSYFATPNLGDIQATKIITGSPTTIPDGGFSFVLKDGSTTVGTAQTDKAGTVSFSMDSNFQLPASGTTTLVMREVQPDTLPAGWTYSGATYNVIVGTDGSISYQTNDGIPLDGLPTFTNSYTAPVLSAIQATKIITGNPTTIPDGGFSFVLKDGSTTVGTAQTDKAGTVTFSMNSNFQLPASGTTTLVMSEVQPGTVPTGWTYSNATYNVIIGADGSVSYQTSGGAAINDLPSFTNNYMAVPVTPETPTPTAVAGESSTIIENPYTGNTAYPPLASVFAMLGLAGLVTAALRKKHRDHSNDKRD
ncbi:Spy0128 family protein [Ethanoligenens harbinense]|uniref:Streptococcal pilin isopeptide linkage domain-containing protein n=1 Tax=Ethanoligenens harbinense (strain DSM 18485 / JCM 12961 / CGMCC 1.5033 / YUAN-3) TaxID=663278 RepID=E6U521_ETHHY|nr:FctA domain-containing protein [Ethanoligenens harbinense]ADU26727.1 hypothetical protein Ethha_1176 [Ethanoligenens harbinense YUAN-3]